MSNKLILKKKKKIFKIKYLIYILIIFFSFIYTFYYSIKINNKDNNEGFINIIMKTGNINIINKNDIINYINTIINKLLKINIKKPYTILNTSILKDNVKTNKNSNNLFEDDYSNMEELKEISSYIKDPNPVDINNPIVYIYNTHQLENYNNDNLKLYGITPNVLMASYFLKEKLNKKGISTIVETSNITEFLNTNGWDFSASYKASRLYLLNNINKYKSLNYFIDIHRDSVKKKVSTIKIKDKMYAKILFVVGLEHKNYQQNLNNMNKINNLFNKYYKGLSRGVYKKSGKGVNGIYNQDLNSNVILIELGGVDNSIEEVFNTIEALADVLYYYIKGEGNE